jgi:hypothetical protein
MTEETKQPEAEAQSGDAGAPAAQPPQSDGAGAPAEQQQPQSATEGAADAARDAGAAGTAPTLGDGNEAA